MNLKNDTLEWQSPSLGHKMTLTVYGNSGTPVLIINDTHFPEKDLLDAVSYQLSNGYNQVFCLSPAEEFALNNKKIKPDRKLVKSNQLECYLIDEVVPRIKKENSNSFIILAGFGTGAGHAVNFAFKHPGNFRKLIAVSGKYDTRSFFRPFYNDDVYYNNPMDYLPNLADRKYLNDIYKMDIRFAVGNEDPNIEETYRICGILQQKSVSYQLDIWNENDRNIKNHWAEALLRHIV